MLKGRLEDFVKLLRPQFLLGSVMLFLVGSVYAGRARLDLNVELVFALMAVVLVQIFGHLVNDYFDREGDVPSRRTLFAGGSGMIQSGSFSARSVLLMTISAGISCLLLAALVVALTGRGLFLPLMVLGLAGGWAYSAPPVRLASTWFGELSVALLLGIFLPLTGAYFISGTFDLNVLVLGFPLFLFSLESLIGVEFPDEEADLASGKKNLTYRLGIGRSKLLHIVLLMMSYAAVGIEILVGSLMMGALLLLVTLPLSIYSSWKLIGMQGYDFAVSKTASNVGMMVNGISMAMMLAYVVIF